MTMNMRNAIEQAAYEAGRALAKYEMLIGSVSNAIVAPEFAYTAGSASLVSKPIVQRPGRVAKASTKAVEAPKEPKAPVIARGVRMSSGPREKGVKKAIVNLIAEQGINGGVSTTDIIAKLGFKSTSVNSTLMGLKKTGVVVQDGKLWIPAPHGETGNSDSTDHAEMY